MKKIIITLSIIAVTAVFAQNGQPPKGGTPPQEAITACDGKDTGTSCTVQTPRGDTLSGTCQKTPDNKYFACKPKNHKRK